MDSLRDSFIGQVLRAVSSSWLPYPEESLHFKKSREKILHSKETSATYEPSGGIIAAGTPLQQHANHVSKALDARDAIICDWNGDDDPANPHNWSTVKKMFAIGNVTACTLVVYMTGPIFAPCQEHFMEEFGTSHQYTALGLSMFAFGYALGPLVFSPLSEVPRIGRNLPYVTTFVAFIIVTIPLALPISAAAFMGLRFLQGLLGSPILATGGASLADLYKEEYVPFAMIAWTAASFSAPSIGPIIASAAIPRFGWRFSMWEVLIGAAPVMILLLFWPETSSATILYRRAACLRKLTGNDRIRSAAEIAHAGKTFKDIVMESLLVPARLTVLDPAILFANVYMMLVYGIFYSFFESFPLIYGPMYGFNYLQKSLAFLPLAIGTVTAAILNAAYLYFYRLPRALSGISTPPGQVLVAAMVACFTTPVGLFMFGWSANPEVHWVVSMVGVGLYAFGVFFIFQAIFLYLPKSYPQYAASLFAAADLTRSCFAVAAFHFARPMFVNLGIGGGCSLLAGLMVLCIFGLYSLFYWGPSLRARSKFAEA